jgi:hypothetical protein
MLETVKRCLAEMAFATVGAVADFAGMARDHREFCPIGIGRSENTYKWKHVLPLVKMVINWGVIKCGVINIGVTNLGDK